MEGREGLQDFQRAGQDERRQDSILDGPAVRQEPPREQEQADKSAGQAEACLLRHFLPDPEPAQAHDQRQSRDKTERKNKKTNHHSFSSGKTLISTRRFFLLCSGLLASVMPGTGFSQPLPSTLNLFGSNLYLSMIDLRTASARS